MNLLQQFINSPLTEQIGWCLLHSLWQIALLGILLKLALTLVSDSARLRYRLAIAGMMTAVLAVMVTFAIVEPSTVASTSTAAISPVPVSRDSQPVSTLTTNEPLEEVATTAATPTTEFNVAAKNDFRLSAAAGSVAPPATASQQLRIWIPWLVALWLVGTCLFAIRPIVGLQAAWRVRWSGRSPAPEKTRQRLRQLAGRLSLRRSVELSLSRLVQVPTVVGIFRPAILLPFSSLTSLSATELEAILLHELAHIRRHDHLVNLLQTFVETILFYHPAIWWMSSVARNQRELCCDDLAIQSGGNSKSLARALLTLEEKRVATPALAANGGALLNRVRRLTGKQRTSHDRRLVWLGGVAALLVASLCLFVSFSDLAHASESNLEDEGDLVRVELVSLNDYYAWHSVTTTDPRLMHRFWNLFPEELRENDGEQRDGWQPDLEVRFTRVGKSGGPPEIVNVKLGVQDGFRWSVGRGVWLMPDQWPLRYSLGEIMRQDTQLVQQKYQERQDEFLELFRTVNKNLEEQYREALDQYQAILNERDTITLPQNSDLALTLHQVKVRELDEELSRLRDELTDARTRKQYMLDVQARGDDAIKAWLENEEKGNLTAEAANIAALRQKITELELARQQMLDRFGAGHPDIRAVDRQIELWRAYLEDEQAEDSEPDERSPGEKFEGHLQQLEQKIALLDARYMAINEEFKFHFEKAKQLEQINSRLEEKQEEIDLIREWLAESRAKVTELRANSTAAEGIIEELTRGESGVADGMVVTVAPGLNMVTINLGSDDLIIPGQEFLIYDSQANSFDDEPGKAKIEVSRVFGPHRAEARITSQDITDPILRNDLVVSPDPGDNGSSQDQAADTQHLMREQLFNNTTYHREREKLVADHTGRWVAIVDGRLLASFDSFEECLAAADEANPHAVHRYIFRPGVDDVDDEFTYSPWMTGQPNWWQFGRQFTHKNRMTIAWDRWGKADKWVPAPEGKASFTLNAPGGEELQLKHSAVCSQMVTQQLTITEDDVNRLRLHRFSIPGKVRSTTYDVDCYRVNVQAAIPELDINQRLVAIVMPQSVVKSDPPGIADLPSIQVNPMVEQDAALPPEKSDQQEGSDQPEDVIEIEVLDRLQNHLLKEQPDTATVREAIDSILQDARDTANAEDDATVNIRVIEGLGTFILTGEPEDVARVREVLEKLLKPRQSDDEKQVETPEGVQPSGDQGRAKPRWDGISEISRDVRSIGLQSGRGRILQLDHTVAEIVVEVPDMVRVTPIGRNQLIVHALAPGRCSITLRGDDVPLRTIEVVITEAENEGGSVSLEVVGDSQAIILKGDPDELATVRAELQRIIGAAAGEEANPPSSETTDETPDDDQSRVEPGSTAEETWTVVGIVTDNSGQPLSGVRVWAATGAGSLRQTGETTTDENGTYELEFGPGMLSFQANDFTNPHVAVQAATIYAAKDGYSEIHLCMAGDRLMASEMPTEDTAWGTLDQIRDKLILPGQPVTIDFMMQPATRIEGYLVDQNGHLLQRRSLSLAYGGQEIAPSTNVLAQVWSDRDAHFAIDNVPLNKPWKLEFEIPNTRNEATTEVFRLEETDPHRWLVTVDLDANPPMITTSPLSDKKAEELAGQNLDSGDQHRVIRGQIPSEEDDRDLVFGDENKGLQAAIHFPNGRQAAIGDQLEMAFVIRNSSDQDIVFESDPWRQEDNFKLWRLGDQGREKKQDYGITWHSGIGIMKEYHLGPGEEVIIDAGELAILDPDGPAIELEHPAVWGASMEPGRYSAWFRIYLPRRFVETDSWNGTVTTGEVEFEVTE